MQLYVHFEFAVKYRKAVIRSEWEEELHKYITGIVKNNGHKLWQSIQCPAIYTLKICWTINR
jgi:hypothetical protein